MLIKSNYKDYYDYLQGIYGIDRKIVYERVCYQINLKEEWIKAGLLKPKHLEPIYRDYQRVLLAICGIVYCVYIVNKKFYFGLNHSDYEEKKYSHITNGLSDVGVKDFVYDLLRDSDGVDYSHSKNKYHLTATDLNEKLNCPVLVVDVYKGYGNKKYIAIAKNVRLSDYGIAQIISPHDMYISIGNFLSRENVFEDKRTDVQKIIGKGFDKKTSFRNVK